MKYKLRELADEMEVPLAADEMPGDAARWEATCSRMLGHPPAQAAQADNSVLLHRATWIADMTSDPTLGLTPNENTRIHRFACEIRDALSATPTAEPVAQGEVGPRFASNEDGRTGLIQACKVASNPSQGATVSHMRWLLEQCAKHLAPPTHPHSPDDAADSGRVGFDEVIAALRRDIDDHGVAEIRQAELAALAVRVQGDSDGMCNQDTPERRCVCREEFGYRVCEPSSPAGVPDGWSITPEPNPLGGKNAMCLRDPSGRSALFGTFSEEVVVRDFLAAMLAAAASAPEGGEVEL